MNFIIKSCRCLLLLAVFTGCGGKGEPVTLYSLYDTSSFSPVVVLVSPALADYAKEPSHSFSSILNLYKVENEIKSDVPVIVDYTISHDTLFMKPRYMPDANAVFEAVANINNITSKLQITTPDINVTAMDAQVRTVYPTSDKIPANLLMFHVVFATPMNENSKAYEHVKLIDESGEEKKMVWREKSNWTSDGKHLVMMIHPGWVKKEIRYMDNYGPRFEQGKKYTLVVTQELKDRYNRSITAEYKKQFTIVEPDQQIPKLTTTNVQSIQSNTRDTLRFSFSEALDYGSVLIGIAVKDDDGNVVDGEKICLRDDFWAFVPAKNWEKKKHTIELLQDLTDVASNHFHRLFEVTDLEMMQDAPPIEIEFTPN